jgi:putative nucleotidyltransferase with HDIG domain
MNLTLKHHYKRLQQNPKLINGVVMAGSLILVLFLLTRAVLSGLYNYEVGSEVKEDIYLKSDVIDTIETDELKAMAVEKAEPITFIDFSKLVEAKKKLTDFFTTLSEIKRTYADDKELLKRVYAGIEKDNAFDLTEDELYTLALLSQERTAVLQNYAIDITSENMANGISNDDIDAASANIDAFIVNLTDLREVEQTILTKIVHGALTVNRFIDVEATTEKQNSAAEQVSDVVYKKGTPLAYKGETLTEKQYQILADGRMLYASIDYAWMLFLGIGLIVLLLWLIMHFYLFEYQPALLRSSKKYGLLMAAFTLVLLLTPFFNNISSYLMPLPLFGMLVSMMLSSAVAVPFGIGLLIIVTLWHNLSIGLTVMYMLGLLFSTMLSKNIRQRSQLMMNGVYTSIIMTVFTAAWLLLNRTDPNTLLMTLLFTIINGIICAIITIGVMPIFETLFGILTPFRLLELSNPNRDILKRLMLEAPGTYHHSILVGNLAETAAHDIGADNVLARVASFYHDIGKLERPYYFKENQIAGENPHDMIPPQVSAGILKQHVSHGLILAKKHKLPEEIQRIIVSHHGTTIIKYFYHLEQQKNADADYKPFTYDGPKPETREEVIVMLADSVEAAVRTLDNPTKPAVRALVDKIVDQKREEAQLDKSDITLKELECVKDSFMKVLSGIFHERIAYPEVELPQRGKETDADEHEHRSDK